MGEDICGGRAAISPAPALVATSWALRVPGRSSALRRVAAAAALSLAVVVSLSGASHGVVKINALLEEVRSLPPELRAFAVLRPDEPVGPGLRGNGVARRTGDFVELRTVLAVINGSQRTLLVPGGGVEFVVPIDGPRGIRTIAGDVTQSARDGHLLVVKAGETGSLEVSASIPLADYRSLRAVFTGSHVGRRGVLLTVHYFPIGFRSGYAATHTLRFEETSDLIDVMR